MLSLRFLGLALPFVLGLLASSCKKTDGSGTKVINGEAAVDAQGNEAFKGVVKLVRNMDQGVCTGTWISQTLMLTAAHCISDDLTGGVHVHTGGNFRDAKLAARHVLGWNVNVGSDRRWPNSKWSSQSERGSIVGYDTRLDIAFLKFDPPDAGEQREVMPLSRNYQFQAGDEVIMVGFGYTKSYTGQNEDILQDRVKNIGRQRLTGLVRDRENGTPQYYKIFSSIQVGGREQNVAPGDSGGPLLLRRGNNYEVIGVVSSAYMYEDKAQKNLTTDPKRANFVESHFVATNSREMQALMRIVAANEAFAAGEEQGLDRLFGVEPFRGDPEELLAGLMKDSPEGEKANAKLLCGGGSGGAGGGYPPGGAGGGGYPPGGAGGGGNFGGAGGVGGAGGGGYPPGGAGGGGNFGGAGGVGGGNNNIGGSGQAGGSNALGNGSSGSSGTARTPTQAFEDSCGGGGCHSAGARLSGQTTIPSNMPKPPKTLSSADRPLVERYLKGDR